MYSAHSTFVQPINENIKIWRYLDLSKFISMLDTQSLFFTRVDRFEDSFEGSIPSPNIKSRSSSYLEFMDPEKVRRFEQFSAKTSIAWRKYFAVNCWHENNNESVAMWRQYIKSNEGVAICSSYGNLKRSLIDKTDIYLGKVSYIDYEKDMIEDGQSFEPYMFKRKSYEHEKEIRALICKPPIPAEDSERPDFLDTTVETIDGGINIEVDLLVLIKSIYVAPNTPSWFYDVVKNVIGKYGYSFEVFKSQLNNSPNF